LVEGCLGDSWAGAARAKWSRGFEGARPRIAFLPRPSPLQAKPNPKRASFNKANPKTDLRQQHVARVAVHRRHHEHALAPVGHAKTRGAHHAVRPAAVAEGLEFGGQPRDHGGAVLAAVQQGLNLLAGLGGGGRFGGLATHWGGLGGRAARVASQGAVGEAAEGETTPVASWQSPPKPKANPQQPAGNDPQSSPLQKQTKAHVLQQHPGHGAVVCGGPLQQAEHVAHQARGLGGL
jgi:hypothetical protein